MVCMPPVPYFFFLDMISAVIVCWKTFSASVDVTSDKFVKLLGPSRNGHDLFALDTVLEPSYEGVTAEFCRSFLQLVDLGLPTESGEHTFWS